ncbi:DedA family protein [Paenibacillus sp. W2I17]|uniref:DedA family protein n=1 Tax=Paenibacillus sp. W2I17 TaxID=3042311 RepID=UPI00278137D7|nr:DedA family protein [Paenibacillus sp. W2I17]MDQ0655970.1 membrane-associated protein [Paenibacillus sp. W2I17]
MFSDTLLELVTQYGYVFFFLAFSLGPFGIPVPNEIIIVSGSILSHTGVVNYWAAYSSILTGLLTAITISYTIGRFFGHKFKKRWLDNRYFLRAESILKRKGDLAMFIGMFIPMVRYIMPLLIGMSEIHFKKFAIFTYSSAVTWTITYFALGIYFKEPVLSMMQILGY